MNIKEKIFDIISAIELSIFYISTIFINTIISDRYGILPSIIYMLLVAAVFGIALVSKNKKIWLLKVGVSVPFSYLVLQYFWKTHYYIRALNQSFPNYGRDTAGGRFAGSLLLLFFSVLCLISGGISLNINIRDYDSYRIKLFVFTSAFAVFIVCIVLISERQFPSYEYIVSHM